MAPPPLPRPPELVEQRYSSWDSWPEDVRERLREWNKLFLLSFRHGPDFKCEGGCGRWVKAHPQGNPVVRYKSKAHGAVCCEDCVISFARRSQRPPMLGKSAETYKMRLHVDKLQRLHDALIQKNIRLKQQIFVDNVYIDALEAAIDTEVKKRIKDELRGKYREP